MVRERRDLSDARDPERELLHAAAEALRSVAALIGRRPRDIDLDVLAACPRPQRLAACRSCPRAARRVCRRRPACSSTRDMIALAALAIGADARVASRLEPPEWLERSREQALSGVTHRAAGRGAGWPPSVAWPSATRASARCG